MDRRSEEGIRTMTAKTALGHQRTAVACRRSVILVVLQGVVKVFENLYFTRKIQKESSLIIL